MKIRHLLFAVAALLIAGCQKPDPVVEPEVSISVQPTVLNFDGNAGSADVTVTASDSWSVSGVPSWMTLTPSSGKSGNTKVTVSVQAGTESARNAEVTFKASTKTASLTVNQEAVPVTPPDPTPVLTGDVTTVELKATETEGTFKITAKDLKGMWTVTPKATYDWVSDYTKEGTTSGNIVVKVVANTTDKDRTAEFTVASEGASNVELKLTQKGAEIRLRQFLFLVVGVKPFPVIVGIQFAAVTQHPFAIHGRRPSLSPQRVYHRHEACSRFGASSKSRLRLGQELLQVRPMAPADAFHLPEAVRIPGQPVHAEIAGQGGEKTAFLQDPLQLITVEAVGISKSARRMSRPSIQFLLQAIRIHADPFFIGKIILFPPASAALFAAALMMEIIAVILEFHTPEIAHFQQFLPAGMHVGSALLRQQAEFIRALSDHVDDSLCSIPLQQGEQAAVTALIPIVKSEQDRFFRQGYSVIYKLQDILHEYRRVAFPLKETQIAFHLLRQDRILSGVVVPHLMIHENRQQDFLRLLLPEFSVSVQRQNDSQRSP